MLLAGLYRTRTVRVRGWSMRRGTVAFVRISHILLVARNHLLLMVSWGRDVDCCFVSAAKI
jgi:hypothetical protein